MSLDWGFVIYSINCEQLVCDRYGQALFEPVDFALKSGSTLFIEGANGVGKSSLLKLLAGLKKPSAGEIYWQGRLLDQEITAHDYRAQLHYLGHRNGLLQHLTLMENVRLYAALHQQSHMIQPDLIEDAIARLAMKAVGNKPIAALSAGQQRKAALIRCLAIPKPLYLFDEPFTALDGMSINSMVSLMNRQQVFINCIYIITTHTKHVHFDGPAQYITLRRADGLC